VCGIIIRRLLLKKESFATASGAIVMASGIFIYGSLNHFPWLLPLGDFFALVLLVFWTILIFSFASFVVRGHFMDQHLKNPVNWFAIGTLVAGTSVLVNVLIIYFTEWLNFLYILAVLNAMLWLSYIVYCLPSYLRLFHHTHKNQV